VIPRLLRQILVGTVAVAGGVFLVIFWSAVALWASDAATWVVAWLLG
jgi:hypothetical protein